MIKIVIALTGLLCALPAAAQSYPNKPIKIVVGFSAGSASDLLARAVGTKLTESLGQPVVIENKPGAGSMIAAQAVATANPDGYTLLVVSAAHAASPALYKTLPYDTVKDFAGVSRIANVPSMLIVSPALNIHSVANLVAAMKAKPTGFNYSSPGTGSANHLASVLLLSKADLKAQHIAYKGIPEALTAVASGEVQFAFLPVMNVLPLVTQGKVVALGVSTATPSQVMASVPPVGNPAGVAGYQFDPWFGLLAPAKVPKAKMETLAATVDKALRSADIKEKFLQVGADPAPLTLGQFDAYIQTEIAKFKAIATSAGITPE
jgi:tripartite-type tricarboxylate transporter receptor subunit TctC